MKIRRSCLEISLLFKTILIIISPAFVIYRYRYTSKRSLYKSFWPSKVEKKVILKSCSVTVNGCPYVEQNRAGKLLHYLGNVIVNGPSTPLVTDIPPAKIKVLFLYSSKKKWVKFTA
jgi:hypothetical protein